MSGALAIRADGGPGIGAGHVMRSLAIADAWRAGGGRVDWFSVSMPSMLADLLTARGIEQHTVGADGEDSDAPLAAWSRRHPDNWIVVDGYSLRDVPSRLRRSGARVAIVDDTAEWPFYNCDLLINQNPGADALSYRTSASARLLGPGFALLRDEFLTTEPPHREFDGPAHRVLVSFGGHDAHGQARRVTRVLSRLAVDVDLAIGVIGTDALDEGSSRLRFHRTVNLAPLMRTADLAVVAAGSVCWELAYMGLPALALIVAGNQEPVARGLDELGVVRNLGWYDRIDESDLSAALITALNDPERAALSRNGRNLIDGRGASRVVNAMTGTTRSMETGEAQA